MFREINQPPSLQEQLRSPHLLMLDLGLLDPNIICLEISNGSDYPDYKKLKLQNSDEDGHPISRPFFVTIHYYPNHTIEHLILHNEPNHGIVHCKYDPKGNLSHLSCNYFSFYLDDRFDPYGAITSWKKSTTPTGIQSAFSYTIVKRKDHTMIIKLEKNQDENEYKVSELGILTEHPALIPAIDETQFGIMTYEGMLPQQVFFQVNKQTHGKSNTNPPFHLYQLVTEGRDLLWFKIENDTVVVEEKK